MNNDLISIVVPIYNVENYLNECIESLIKQTYKNIEIILVDDGSSDNCSNICEEYAKKDTRIKVIHKEHGGPSEARNYGIDIATGTYMVFVDSDDYVDVKYVEMLYNAIKTNNTKVSQCNFWKINDKGEFIEKVGYLDNQIKNGKDMIMDLYNGYSIVNIVAWNKMYAIELFDNLRYPVGKIHEDEYITYKIFYNTDKIAVINEYLYNYRQNENSITGRYLSGKECIEMPKKRRKGNKKVIEIKGATENNLQNLDVKFPLGVSNISPFIDC